VLISYLKDEIFDNQYPLSVLKAIILVPAWRLFSLIFHIRFGRSVLQPENFPHIAQHPYWCHRVPDLKENIDVAFGFCVATAISHL
jgi:hypothetical protein